MKPRRTARLLGLGVVTAGVVNVASALTPTMHSRLHLVHRLLTPDADTIASGAAALVGLVLILLGRGIVQRRKLALWTTIGLLVFSTAAHVLKGFDFEEAVFTTLLAVLLLWNRKLFVVAHEPTRWRTVARAVPVVIALDIVYGMGGLFLRHSAVHPSPTPVRAIHEVGARLVGFSGPLRVGGVFGRWFPVSLTILGGISIVTLLLLILAPVAESGLTMRAEREAVRKLMQRSDGDSLDFFALRRDKRYVFSADRRAAMAYRYVNGVGLGSGDPVGDPASFDDAVARFVEYCDRNGWRPAVLGARDDRLPHYERVGLRAFYLGDEAIVDVSGFSLVGRHVRNIRQSARHTEAAGVTSETCYEGELDPTLRRALVGIADRHRAGAPERGFSMALGGLLNGQEPSCVIVVCRDGSGAPIAFQRYVPCRDGRALSLDAMRRDPDAPGGVNEKMIIDLIEWARAKGIDEVSLNFAAFRGLVQEGVDRTLLQSAQAWVVRRLDPYFQINSLRRFNAKFHPRWVRRFLVYRNIGDLARVGLASLSAESILPFDQRTEAWVESDETTESVPH